MEKKAWTKTGDWEWRMTVSNTEKLTVRMQPGARKNQAIIEWSGKQYVLQIKGFWRGETVIADSDGNEVLSAKPATWYGSTLNVTYAGRTWQWVIRNNPLSEFCLQENGEDILAYSLETIKGKIGLRVRQKSGFDQPLLDALLWYHFHPILLEQTGMDVTTFVLLVA